MRRYGSLVIVFSLQDNLKDCDFACNELKLHNKIHEILKVSKNRKQIFQPKLLPKNLTNYQDRKTNSLVHFLEEVLAGKFAFDFYWPLVNFQISSPIMRNKSNLKSFHSASIKLSIQTLNFSPLLSKNETVLSCLLFSFFKMKANCFSNLIVLKLMGVIGCCRSF